MKLHTLKRSKGIISKSKRLGRGNGSGKGNYSTKGLKGQKARSGSTMKPFFEGGQTSIVQRIPKARGFKRHFKLIKEVVIVNLGALDMDDRITDGTVVTPELLKKLGYIKHTDIAVKILGNGDWTKTVTFAEGVLFSKSAQDKIVNPGKATEKPIKKTVAKEEKKAPTEKKTVAKKAPVAKEEKQAPAEKKVVAKKAPVAKEEKKAPAEKKVVAKKAPAKKKAA